MQTRQVIQVFQLSITSNDPAVITPTHDFYFKTREEAENYLAAMFPDKMTATITEQLTTPYKDHWIALEKTDDFHIKFMNDFTFYQTVFKSGRQVVVQNPDLINTIKANSDCMFPVRLMNLPDKSWLSLFSSLWQPSQEHKNQELVFDTYEAENGQPLMLYVGKDLRCMTVKALATTFKLSTYFINDDIATNIKNLDAAKEQLLAKKEAELSTLAAKFDAEIASLAAAKEKLIASNHALFAKQHQPEVTSTHCVRRVL